TWGGAGVFSTVTRSSSSGPEIFSTCPLAEAFLGCTLAVSRDCVETLSSASEPKLNVPSTEVCSRGSFSCSHCRTTLRLRIRKAHSPAGQRETPGRVAPSATLDGRSKPRRSTFFRFITSLHSHYLV